MATKIGVGESTRFLAKHKGTFARLAAPGGFTGESSCEKCAAALSAARAAVEGLHVFTFNQVAETEKWRRELLDQLSSRRATVTALAARSALDDVDGEAAAGGLLVLDLHVAAGVAHGLDRLVEADLVAAVAAQRQPGGVDRLDRRDGVALDARDLHEAADRVAGEAEVVLDADLGGVLHLRRACRRAPRTSPPAAIEQAEPTSPWQPTSAPEIDAFSLNRMPIAAGGEQEADDAVVVGARARSRT